MTEHVITPAHEDRFHRPKSGFYSACGNDYNPHHAVHLEPQQAQRLGYQPCPDCFPDDPANAAAD